MFIFPGKIVNREVMGDFCINANIFLQWIECFDYSIPSSTKKTFILIFDGCTSHYNGDDVKKATEMKIVLVPFLENPTHLVHPLDVAVFKTFKDTLKKESDKHIEETNSPSCTKIEAITLSSKSWEEGATRRLENIVSDFRSSVIWPPSFKLTMNRLDIYQGGGLTTKLEEPME